jgi:hypothetical protein
MGLGKTVEGTKVLRIQLKIFNFFLKNGLLHMTLIASPIILHY